MKNAIKYYYDMDILYIYIINGIYYFNYNNSDFFLLEIDFDIDIQKIYSLYSELKIRNILTNDIVLNKDNKIITIIDNHTYILVKDNTKNRRITLNDILYFQNSTANIIINKNYKKNNWIRMWQQKIDFYEEQMSIFSKKYNRINLYIDYYIGLGENAISYLKNNIDNSDSNYCFAHKRINIDKNTFDFYNPLNYTVDNRVRDFVEYTKQLFFRNNLDFENYKYYLDYMNYNKNEYILLISRLLFPTYYFDVHDSIIINNLDDILLNDIISKTNLYMKFIKKIYMYIVYQKRINIPFIDWIIKDAN